MQEINDVLKRLLDEHLTQELGEPDAVVVVEARQTGQTLGAEVIPYTASYPVPASVGAPDPFENPAMQSNFSNQFTLQYETVQGNFFPVNDKPSRSGFNQISNVKVHSTEKETKQIMWHEKQRCSSEVTYRHPQIGYEIGSQKLSWLSFRHHFMG